MPLEIHNDECAKATGDVHTLYIRQGDSPWRQRFKKVGIICSACYRVDLYGPWLEENEQEYETVKRKKPKERKPASNLSTQELRDQIISRVNSSAEESTSQSDQVSQNDDNNDTG